MRAGTDEILACLKRQRTLRLTKQHFTDLANDVEALGKENFVKAVADVVLAQPAPRSREGAENDPLLGRMARSRKQAGLSAADFNLALSKNFSGEIQSEVPKSALASGPKYLAYLRKALTDAEIEAGFAHVLREYA